MIKVDIEQGIVSVEEGGLTTTHRLDTPEAFRIISDVWLRAGWDNKHVYTFTWLGRPIIQLPEDMFRIQEVIHSVRPDVIVETGVAHGGSLVFYASLCKAMECGRVIGVDVEIRPHNRAAIESHILRPLITLVEGSSIEPSVVENVRSQIAPGARVMVMLDSCHTKEHVLAELEAYSGFVSPGSYIVAMDGIMEKVVGGPRTQPDWSWNNPRQASLEFVRTHPEFTIEEPAFAFNESNISERVTYWPSAFIRRLANG
jgi:cephalosporin hydroxylase